MALNDYAAKLEGLFQEQANEARMPDGERFCLLLRTTHHAIYGFLSATFWSMDYDKKKAKQYDNLVKEMHRIAVYSGITNYDGLPTHQKLELSDGWHMKNTTANWQHVEKAFEALCALRQWSGLCENILRCISEAILFILKFNPFRDGHNPAVMDASPPPKYDIFSSPRWKELSNIQSTEEWRNPLQMQDRWPAYRLTDIADVKQWFAKQSLYISDFQRTERYKNKTEVNKPVTGSRSSSGKR